MNKLLQSVIVCFALLVSVGGYADPRTPAGTITPAGTPAALSTTYGTASSETTFTFTATGLAAAETVTVTAPAGFEVSLTTGSGFATAVTKDADGAGAIASTSIFVRLVANAGVAGSPYSGNIALSSATATTANIATTASTVSAKALTMTGLTVPASKVYDATTTAPVSGTPTLQASEAFGTGTPADGKPYTGDVVNIAGTAVGTYNSKDVATAATVTYSGLNLGGAQAANYTLTIQSDASATITAKALTMSGLSVPATKVYDATTDVVVSGTAALPASEAPGAGTTSDGKPYTGDVVSITGTATGSYNSKDVATAASVTYAGLSLTGAQSGNYSFTIQTAASATITAKALTESGLSVPASKVYNGTTAAVVSGTATLQPAEAVGAGTTSDGKPYTGDVVNITGTATGTYNNKNVPTASSVAYGGLSLAGAQAGNYSLTAQSSDAATITTKALTMSGLSAPASKVYDATTSAVVSGTAALQGASAPGGGTTSDGKPYTGDVVSITGTATGTYNNKDVATAATVTYGGLSLTGAQATNYSFTVQSAAAATITKKNLTITGVSANNKVFDGTTAGTLSGTAALLTAQAPGAGTTSDGKPYTGDVVNITGSPTATFASAATIAGSAGVNVTVTGYTLGGAQNGNYTAVQPTGLTANIQAGEPTGQARNISFSSVTAVSMTVSWATPGSGTPGSNRLILVREGGAVSATPADFTSYTASADWSVPGSQIGSGNYVVYNGTGTSVALTNLNPSVTYHVQIFEFNGAPGTGLENYLTATATNNPRSQATNNVDNTATFTGGTGPLTISSITNNNMAPTMAFQFVATDLGSGDATSTRFSQLIFRPGAGNQIADWTQIIGGAELFDNIGNGGPVTGNSKHAAAIIGTNTITIPGIDAGGPPKLGSIYDPVDGTATRTYTLKIWLKASLGGSLPANVDGQHLAFSVTGADATPVVAKGTFAPGSTTSSGGANNEVTVTATAIRINQQPSAAATSSVALAQQPIFEAIDVNNNRDLLNNALTVGTSNGTIGTASAPTNFVNGLADFTLSGFNFSSTGTTTMNVSITSPNLTSPNTSSITVTSSTNLGASTEVVASSPLISSTTLNPVLGFSINTAGSVTNLTDLVFTSTLPPAGYVKNFKLFANTVDSYAGATQVATSPSLTFSGMSIPINSSLKYFFLAVDIEPFFPNIASTMQFSLPAGNFTVSAGGAKTGSTQSSVIYSFDDVTPPVIQSIVVASPVNAWSTTNGTSAGLVQFTVTFTEPVFGLANTDFRVVTDGTVSTLSRSLSGSGTTYTVTVPGISGIGHVRIELADNDTFTDNNGNFFQGPGNTDYFTNFTNTAWYYSIVLPAPSNPVVDFNITTQASYYAQAQITHDLLGAQFPTHYLIMARESQGAVNFPTVTDGIPIADDIYDGTNIAGVNYFQFNGDGLFIANIASNKTIFNLTQPQTFITLKAGVNYDYIVYPYTKNAAYSDDNINYGTPTSILNAFTQIANNGSLTTTGVPGASAIQSTVDEASAGQEVFQFQISDGKLASNGSQYEYAPTKISGVTLSKLAVPNSVSDWSTVIKRAELYDIANPTVFVTATGASITASQISFAGIPSLNSGDIGYIDPSTESPGCCVTTTTSSKTFGVRIFLSSTSGALTGSDGKTLAFTIANSTADITYNLPTGSATNHQTGSTITGGSSASSVTTTIDILATKLAFTTNFPSSSSIGVLHPLLAPKPVIQAVDANNNIDKNFSSYNVSTAPVVGFSAPDNFVNGILTLNNFVFTDPGTGVVTTFGGSGITTTAVANAIDVVISGATSVASAGTPPAQIQSTITTAPTGVIGAQQINFQFTVTDDNAVAAALDDALPTRISGVTIRQNTALNGTGTTFDDWTESIAGAQLSIGNTNVGGSMSRTSNTIVFSGIPNSSILQPGYIPDNGSKTYTLSIWLFPSPTNAALQDIIDNEDFVFELTGTSDFSLTSSAPNYSSTLATFTAFNSGNNSNSVDVDASQLDFITQPAANQSYDANITPQAQLKARDVHGNLDADFSFAVTNITFGADFFIFDGRTYPVNGGTGMNFASGILNVNAAMQVSSAGGGFEGDQTNFTVVSNGLSQTSSTFALHYSGASNIIKDPAFASANTYASGNGYPENILYASFQANTFTANTDGIALERFVLQDGGGSADADGTATRLQSITLNISNYQYLRTLAIYDGATKIAERAVAGNIYGVSGITGNIDFTTLLNPLLATDAIGSNDFTVYATFNQTAVADNALVQVRINGATTAPVSSGLAIGGAVTTFAPLNAAQNENKIEVVATQIVYTSVPAGASINASFVVVAQAWDAFSNLDADYNGAISFTGNGNTSGYGVANAPAGPFVAGVLNYPLDNPGTAGVDEGFYFTSGSSVTRLTINGAAANTGGTSIDAGAITGTSPAPGINVKTSYDSWLYFDPSFAYNTKIPFVSKQEDPLTNSINSIELARLVLSDGGAPTSTAVMGTNPSPGVKNMPFGQHNDEDGAFTKMDQFTLSLTNFADIRKIALFDAFGNKIGSDQTPAATVTFTGLSGVAALTAADNDVAKFYIRASFNQTVGADLDQINMQITNVLWSAGSQFPEQLPVSPPPTVGGIDGTGTGGDSSDPTKNYIDVVATSLDFVSQAAVTPPAYAGINEDIGPSYTSPPLPSTKAPIIHARDQFSNLDTEFNFPASVTGATANAVSSASFIAGILDLDGMQYSSTGDGTLTIGANGISSATSPSPGQLIDVINVAATYPSPGTIIQGSGTPPTYSIKGGSLGQIIFGVTFTAEGATGSEPSLKEFSFRFDKPYTNSAQTTFENFVVKEGITDVNTLGGNLLFLSSTSDSNLDIIKITFGSPRPLFSAPGQQLTYYLVADVNVGANISTPAITPYFEDAGYLTPSDASIVVTKGTAKGQFNGNQYTFASTKPPVLKTNKSTPANPSLTNPYAGQLNVDPNITHIDLEFDTKVSTLDGGENGGAELIRRSDNVKVADLIAPLTTGNYLATQDEKLVINPLRYNIVLEGGVPLVADEVYYVTIKKGSFDPIVTPSHPMKTGTGIADQGLNFFGGISSSSTLYFKISSIKPLILGDAKAKFYNTKIGTLSTKFDQFGTAYYLIVPTASIPPTSAQVKGTAVYPGTTAAKGNYTINQVNTLQTTTFEALPPTSFIASQQYDIYVYAENDANPTPVASGGVYGSLATNFAVNTTGPTVKAFVPSSPVAASPAYLICPNSYVTVTDPIILSEATISRFSSASIQDVNILLPTGYEFDLTTPPNIQLIGSDFVGTANTSFISNTVLKVSYLNFGASSNDYIVISNMRLKGASGSSAQTIFRFYGNNTSFASPTASVGTIGLFNSQTFTFTNTYSQDNAIYFPVGSPTRVNAIPDNYADDTSPLGTIRLLPNINVANDYNASIFTGTGVTNDLLTLSAVQKDAAFNIVMNHVDPNGCVSQITEQYLVYDHTSPITKKLGTANTALNPPGTAQTLVNPGFPSTSSPAILPAEKLFYNEVAGYNLVSLKVDLPVSVLKENPALPGYVPSQIMHGNEWRTAVQMIPVTPPELVAVPPFGNYYNYYWDYSHVLNAPIGGSVEIDPYNGNLANRFDAVTGSKRNTYWKGGSLGKVEFTGLFQSSADLQVFIPFRQDVELFVPALPLIEIGSSNQSAVEPTDATLNNFDSKTPDQHINIFQYTGTAGYEGTPIFCEAGGPITLNGYPAALAGTSVGTFALYDYKTYNFNSTSNAPIPTTSTDFVDNGNGTSTINPVVVKNGYDDILVAYTYQENNSPTPATGYIVIRVVGNPTAKFNLATDLTLSATGSSNIADGMASAINAYCERIPINFTPTTAANIASYNWNFGDNSSVNNTASTNAATPDIRNTYPTIGSYHATLTTVSNYNCSSINTDNFADITVGSIPTFPIVAFDLTGISTADQIVFTDRTTAASNFTSFSKIQNVTWNYGDATAPNGLGTHQYTTPGHYKVKSVVTTAIGPTNITMTAPGCVRLFDRNIVILDKKTGFYEDDFEGATSYWQFIQDSLNINGKPSVQPPSWTRGTPSASRASINSTPNIGIPNNNIWATGLTGIYLGQERSFLYSPSMDMTSFQRPMISFDANWDLNKDGAVLEYSVDNLNVADPNKVWATVGDNKAGVKWFNDQVIGSKPGKQPSGDFGWSGTSTDDVATTGWVESKHELTLAVAQPTLNRTNVVFRFAFASDNDGHDGFAFDNFRIGERTRTILLENFTTTNGKDGDQNTAARIENQTITNFQTSGFGTTVVKLSYHIGFTGADPFNLDNPADPSARALYYNVKNVPYAFLDGTRPIDVGNTGFTAWGQNAYDTQTLQLGQADITVPGLTVNPDGSIKFNVDIKALYNLPENTVLHVAVIENSILTSGLSSAQQSLIQAGTNESHLDYVLKQMLPNALGTKFGTPLTKTQTRTFSGFEYYPDPTKLYNNNNDLSILIFLQNESTKSIYQTAYITNILDPPTVTGIEEPVLPLEDIALYPNPADDEFTIQLPTASKTDTRLRLADQVGKIVYDSFIPAGSTEKKVNTQDLATGIYILQVEAGKSAMTRKKVIVMHTR